ncbi:tRNA (adenosine(37)-N6)-dimethylallyltransferase MiaA [Psychrobacter sp. 1U2]|uniref:tRNA (adenosine(37)-N6)-dimethylallyltransferase MiaA n=1 Tax=Psychrobacter sp. 1U2 TaxID=3453577 RepID=UPI003F467FF2
MLDAPHPVPDNSVICLMAPTASGKTALAYELYDSGRYELISVDSALIYREMDIGTAKPTAAELQRYPHHLVDIIDPTQSYSVAEFVSDVERLINECHAKGKIPLLVGGTMMYYMALIEGLSPVPDSDEQVRRQVEQWRQIAGISALYDYLADIDPQSHQRLARADTQRITRAVEVYKQTNIPISDWQRQPKQALAHNPNQQWLVLSVLPERSWLHERISQRLDIMWQEGLVAEVVGLLERYPLTPNMPAMRCVGYRQVLEYLVHINHPVFERTHLDKSLFYEAFAVSTEDKIKGAKDDDQAVPLNSTKPMTQRQHLACEAMQNKALYATRQLAKRQYTWLRKLSRGLAAANQSTVAPAQSDTSLTDTQHNIVISSFTSINQVRDYLQ